MLYSKRTVRCSARTMNREAAKSSLERQFEDAEVLDLKRRGDKWVATLLEPKTADFPPTDDEEEETPKPPKAEGDSDSDDSPDPSSDESAPSDDAAGPKPPKGEEKGPKGGEAHELVMVMDLLTAIADKLGITPGLGAPGADDPMADPMAPPPPPPPGPPGGHNDPNEIIHRTKLKPGETPPGGTPIGAPAFAHVVGNNEAAQLARMSSFDAFDDTPGKTVKQAHDELTALYGPLGFRVRQIKRVEGGRRLAAKLSRR